MYASVSYVRRLSCTNKDAAPCFAKDFAIHGRSAGCVDVRLAMPEHSLSRWSLVAPVACPHRRKWGGALKLRCCKSADSMNKLSRGKPLVNHKRLRGLWESSAFWARVSESALAASPDSPATPQLLQGCRPVGDSGGGGECKCFMFSNAVRCRFQASWKQDAIAPSRGDEPSSAAALRGVPEGVG